MQLKVLRDFVAKLDFIQMQPEPELVIAPKGADIFARALVEPGKTYWIYLHHSTHKKHGSFITRYKAVKGPHTESMELAMPAGKYAVEWIRPRDGRPLRSDKVTHDGRALRLVSPEHEDADITVKINRVAE